MKPVEWLLQNAEDVYMVYKKVGNAAKMAFEQLKQYGMEMEFNTFKVNYPIFISVYEHFNKQYVNINKQVIKQDIKQSIKQDEFELKERVESLEKVIDVLIDELRIVDRVEKLEQNLFGNDSKELQSKPMKCGKWNLAASGGFYRAFRVIDGRNTGVYVGKDPSLAEEKIRAKGFLID